MSEPKTPPIQAIVAPVTPLRQNCTIVWCTEDPEGRGDRSAARYSAYWRSWPTRG
ncbi:MAG: hypothetical protein WDM85_00655 [Caulobacteraceae bacterium]